MQTNYEQLQTMYRRALDIRSPWLNRWHSARQYTMPTADDDMAMLLMQPHLMQWIIWLHQCTHY